ncbi:histidine phosphatase family protein [Xylanibacter brevis]|uniref:histidine phosphatase family protein n=1 Tax=Xylanibacter brevis TaxID=83231 RepID=UPI000481499A|nr:histidine phosphatase family protein [Xylanibacter brevis]
MTILLLVRHGETVDNARQIMQGQTPGQLNETGIVQARQLRDALTNHPIDVFMASDLHRAVQTAVIVAEPHHLEVQTTPLLRERDWGDFTGRFIPELKNEVWPDNIETLDHMMQRAQQFLDMLKQQYAGKTILAVGHGIMNKAIHAVYHHKPMTEIQRMANAEVRRLEL